MKRYCTSAKCCGNYNYKPVKKNVKEGEIVCPDCGSFLIKEKTRHQPGRRRIGNRAGVYSA